MHIESFSLEGKALNEPIEVEDGDLIIEGYCVEYEGTDRQAENFTEGAFERGAKAFLEGSAPLCFHHKSEKVLGKVLDLREVPGRGVWMRARVDGAIRTHPELRTIYNQIKRGTLKGLSVGGFFKRKLTELGTRISDVDLTEVSITAVPIHAKPGFAVVAGKALELAAIEYECENLEWLRDELIKRDTLRALDLIDIQLSVAGLLK
jgi:HK97 family phage prohead protease